LHGKTPRASHCGGKTGVTSMPRLDPCLNQRAI
jgi:hypothetical protein